MGDRRENMKKSLGITEYPWSSDDDDEPETQGNETLQQRHEPEVSRPSVADNPGTSGQQHIAVPPLICSFNSISSHRPPALTLRRTRDDVPLSLVARQQHAPGSAASTASADVRRILAIRKINRQPSSYRRYNNMAQRHLTLSRQLGSARSNRYSSHASPSLTSGMALRRAQAFPGIEFNNSTESVRDYHDALLRVIAASRPAASEVRAQPATSHAPPHDVIYALGAQSPANPHSNIENPANQQPVNLSHDDSYLEHDLLINENEAPANDERNDIAMEPENDAPAEDAASEGGSTQGTAAGEGGDNDTADGEADGVDGADASMSLEEVVEIDADGDGEPEGDADVEHVDTPQPPHIEEPVANTSSANDEVTIIHPHALRRKRESDEENSELGTVKEFNQSLLRLLECPVCLEWMEPPMWQCRRGHLVCGRCRARLQACPVCRTAFSSVRNRAMESVADMLRYPCRHGCGRALQLRRRAGHEASCAARRYRCPAPQCDSRPPLPHRDLPHHFQSKHLSMVKIGQSHKFSMRVNTEQHDNWIILALNQLFHLRVDVDIRTWGVVVYVAYIGPKCNADDYTYEVSVTGQHNSRKLVYTRSTHCDLECSTLNVSRQDCFHLTLDQALNFLRVRNRHAETDKYLNFSVAITRNVRADEESN